MSFGEKLRNLRHLHEMTQQELASTLAIEQSILSRLENDRLTPTKEQIAKICEKFDIKAADLLEGTSYKVQSELSEKQLNVNLAEKQKSAGLTLRINQQLLVTLFIGWLGCVSIACSIYGVIYPNKRYVYQSGSYLQLDQNQRVVDNKNSVIHNFHGGIVWEYESPNKIRDYYFDYVQVHLGTINILLLFVLPFICFLICFWRTYHQYFSSHKRGKT